MDKKIQLIIFDLDGTLVNAYRAVAASINFTLKKLNCPLQNDETIKRSVGWGDRNLLSRFVGADQIEPALTIYRRHHAQALLNGTTFLPGAKKILQDFKKEGYQLAVASNRPTRFTQIIIRHLKMNRLFNKILCADKLKAGKPDPSILFTIIKQLKQKKSETLYVGDMTIDVETGNRAGIPTVAVLTGSSTQAEIEKLCPYRVISNISELKKVLSEINGGKRSDKNPLLR